MDKFLTELKDTLDEVLSWSEKFRRGERDYAFDIDDELYKLSEKHNKDFKKGELLLIYNLLDFYCDAIKHGFKQIDKDHSVSQAHSDIQSVISILETSPILKLPENLEKRLKSI